MTAPATPRTNWAGNITFCAKDFRAPDSLDALRRDLADGAAAGRVRLVGSAHSFSPIADTAGTQVSLAAMPVVRDLDRDRGLVRVSGGLRYGEITPWLHEQGFALRNLGSLPHIAVAGACATGTHGSGDRNGVLATAVRALEVVTLDGDVVTLSADGEGSGCGGDFAGAVVSLGGIGAVTAVTLAVEPTYDLAQTVYDDVPLDAVEDDFDAFMTAAYSVSLFTRWENGLVDTVWLKARTGEQPSPRLTDLLDGRAADGPRHPLRGERTEPATEQGGIPGPWHARLPHFRLEFTPSAGEELQSEYLVPREHAVEALRAVRALGARVAEPLLVSEIRTMAADDLWLSGAYGRPAVGVHFTWKPDAERVLPVLREVEERLLPLGGRPHWGKVFTSAPDAVRPLYPRLDDARRLLETFDPRGVLSNDMLDAYVRG